MRATDPGPPPDDVLRAFGATAAPARLPGGQRQTYRAGQLVLKPAQDDEETTWVAEFYLTAPRDGFRLPQPRRASGGGFVHAGWQAWTYVEGAHSPSRWRDVLDLCIRFHAAIAGLPKPAYFARREQNPWVLADKVTWGEREIAHHPRIAPAVAALQACLRPVAAPGQLIHGDFGGNVLFAPGLPPAVIDFSPYWRPAAFAAGVVVADAIVWEGADMALLDADTGYQDFYQYLVRAELRRVIELETLHAIYGWDMLGEIEAHWPLIRALQARLG